MNNCEFCKNHHGHIEIEVGDENLAFCSMRCIEEWDKKWCVE